MGFKKKKNPKENSFETATIIRGIPQNTQTGPGVPCGTSVDKSKVPLGLTGLVKASACLSLFFYSIGTEFLEGKSNSSC